MRPHRSLLFIPPVPGQVEVESQEASVGIMDKIVAWLRQRPRPLPGSCAEFDSDPCRFTRSPWIKSLIGSPMLNENVPTTSYDIVGISNPRRRTGRLFIKDMLRLERMIRFGSRGLYSTLGDNMIRAVYQEEFARLVAELRENCPGESLCVGGGPNVDQVQQMATGIIMAGTKSMRPVTRPQERQ